MFLSGPDRPVFWTKYPRVFLSKLMSTALSNVSPSLLELQGSPSKPRRSFSRVSKYTCVFICACVREHASSGSQKTAELNKSPFGPNETKHGTSPTNTETRQRVFKEVAHCQNRTIKAAKRKIQGKEKVNGRHHPLPHISRQKRQCP